LKTRTTITNKITATGKSMGSSPVQSAKSNAYQQSVSADNINDILSQVSAQVSIHQELQFFMSENLKIHPYEPARVIIPAKESKDQDWIIKWRCYSAVSQKQEWFRKKFDLNTIKDLSKRKKRAEFLIDNINSALKQGKIFDPQKAQTIRAEKGVREGNIISSRVAIAIFIQSRKNKKMEARTIDTYISRLGVYERWLTGIKLIDAPMTMVTTEIVESFLQTIINDGKSTRTYNNYLTDISAFYNYFIKKRKVKIIPENPAVFIEKLTTHAVKHKAYLPSQQTELMAYAKENQRRLWLISQFMYYTMARTNELASLKVSSIDIRAQKIYLKASDSKNHDSRWITIPTQLMKYILHEKILSSPGNYYIFSNNNFECGPERAITRRLGSYYRERVLNKLKYATGYTLYSWKHTAIVEAYRSGISPASIRAQTGHRSWTSFEKYLRSLGLFENTEVKNNYPTIPE